MTANVAGEPTVQEFFETIFGPDAGHIHVTSFGPGSGLSNARWFGRRWTPGEKFSPGDNNYFCIGELKVGASGRVLGSLARHHMIVSDDVGTKVDPVLLRAVMGSDPTFKVETSPGNQTWGWVLDVPVEADDLDRSQILAAIRDHMKHNNLTDPGTADPVRYIRLFVGSNTKAAYELADGTFPECSLVEWTPDARVVLEDLAARLLGPGWEDDVRSGKFLSMAQVRGLNASADFSDPWVKLAGEIGLNPRRGSGDGKVDADCPNMTAHSQRPESGFALLGGGAMKCQHGECAHLTVRDMQGLMCERYDEQVRAGQASGRLVEDDKGVLRDVFTAEYVSTSGAGYVARETFARADREEAAKLGVGVGEVQERLVREAQALSEREHDAEARTRSLVDMELQFMDARFCVVEKITGVVELTGPDSRERMDITQYYQFRTHHDGRFKVPVPGQRGGKGLGSYWLDDHLTKPRFRDAGLWPVGQQPPDMLNLFEGLPVQSSRKQARTWTPGSSPARSIDKILAFVRDVLADGDAAGYEYILDWLAMCVANPLSKIGVNLIFIGSQGAGKGTLGRMLLDIFGDKNALHIRSGEQLLGRFTGHLEGVLLVLVDEALFGKDKRTVGSYKALTTEPTMVVEHKGLKPRTVTNHMKFVILSNSFAAVSVEVNDRRASVFEVSDKFKDNNAYFNALWDEWDLADGRQMFMEFLLDRWAKRGAKFNAWKPYSNVSKANMALETADPATAFWMDVLERGNPPGSPIDPLTGKDVDWSTSPVRISNRDMYDTFLAWAKDRRIQHPPSHVGLIQRIGQMCGSSRAGQNRVDGQRERNRTYPKLDQCVAEAEKALKGG